ncbi:MAG: recombinase family protein, partial [Planctomycetes bacterium]|nr:recombinase family protein [Planctomycetota bacterium]
RERIRLVFEKFLELGTGQKVLSSLVRHGLKLPRRQTSGLYAGQVLWKEPTLSALYVILKNPAYAGAFAYGRRTADPTRQVPGRPATGRLRRPREEWIALVKDVYPHYITWDQFETIQQTIEENRFARKRGIRRGAALISGLIRCGRCGHCMRVAYKGNRFQYVCSGARNKYAKPSCQFLSGHRIDAVVVEEFFRVLQPAQINALERVGAKQAAHHRQLIEHLEQEVQRLDYEAKRAERQYDLVDPENRLIAATLEQKWEHALEELEQAKGRLSDASQQTPTTVVIPDELRDAFADVGKRLPELWPRLSVEAKKSLLRTLVTGVNLLRGQDGTVQIRIVWRGGSVTESNARLPVHSLRYTETEQQVAERIRQLAAEGRDNEQIVQQLNGEGFVPCRGGRFTPQIVNKIKARYEIVSNIEQARRGNLPFADTLREIARKVDVDPSWIYRRISNQTIHIEKDSEYHCYLFPHDRHVIQQLQQLKKGSLRRVSIPKVHHNG